MAAAFKITRTKRDLPFGMSAGTQRNFQEGAIYEYRAKNGRRKAP